MDSKKPVIVFVLGGPGAGKSTQCRLLTTKYGYKHLSAGDLLRAEVKTGSEDGTMIQSMIKEGQIVPSRVTTSLLKNAIANSEIKKFLIDGFPRNEENDSSFYTIIGDAVRVARLLHFDCPEEVMEKRILSRASDRVDDNLESIRKRFRTFVQETKPVVERYKEKGLVVEVQTDRKQEEIFQDLCSVFDNIEGE